MEGIGIDANYSIFATIFSNSFWNDNITIRKKVAFCSGCYHSSLFYFVKNIIDAIHYGGMCFKSR